MVYGYEVRVFVLPLAVNVLPAVGSVICIVRACKTARRYFSCFNKSFNSVNLSVEIDSEYLAYVLFLNSRLIDQMTFTDFVRLISGSAVFVN